MEWGKAAFYITVGLVFGFFLNHLNLTFKNEFDVFDILTLAIAILVSWYLQVFTQKRAGNLRIEKDFLIEQAKSIKITADQVRELFLDCYLKNSVSSEEGRKIIRLVKILSNKLNELENTLGNCNKRYKKCKGIQEAVEIYFAYKSTITTNLPSKKPPPFSTQSYNRQERLYRDLHQNISLFILEINRK